jgi:hypothetical protein
MQAEISNRIRLFLDEQLDDFREYLITLLEEINLEVDRKAFATKEKIVFFDENSERKQLEIAFFINDCRAVVKIKLA